MKTFAPNRIALLLISAICLAQPALAAEQINEQRDVRANEKIYIENMRGNVEIKAVSKNVFSVKGKLDEKAEGFELISKDGFTRFEVKMPQSTYSNWHDSNDKEGSMLQIEVPVGSQIEFSGVNANVTASGVEGGSKLTTVNGTIVGKQLKNDISLETVNGEIDSIDNSGRIKLNTVNGEIDDQGSSGRLSAESVNGEIKLQSKATEIDVSVVNGEADLKLEGTERLDFSAVNGEITADLKGSLTPRINTSTVSGSAKLKLEPKLSARFKLEASAGGDIDNKLTSQKADKAKYGPRRSLEFSTGSGDGSIDMSTVSGDLTVEAR
ncbi:DUF4097 family beta strand repeat-containing protein [Rheinheimera sp. SA_1]|uniref:DUF4097 family beta strand repeat-containing protein n=1 Tax=Rheinheimera sp. SA_1 TaxID=1827365 RepID=UPI001E47032F|nr:hypothetical protein [Rheinheimera sp. SA_1]